MISEIHNSPGFNTQSFDEEIKKRLQSQGVPNGVISQGREEIKIWMKENGTSPSEMNGGGQNQSKEYFERKAQSIGVPADIISQGKQAVKAWYMENKQQLTSDNSTDSQSILQNNENKRSDSAIDLFA
jgi:hypothetical protein